VILASADEMSRLFESACRQCQGSLVEAECGEIELSKTQQEMALIQIQHFYESIRGLCEGAQSESPYVCCMLKFISNESAEQIARIANLSIFDKLVIALKFLDNEQLSRLLDELRREALDLGLLSYIVIAGRSTEAI